MQRQRVDDDVERRQTNSHHRGWGKHDRSRGILQRSLDRCLGEVLGDYGDASRSSLLVLVRSRRSILLPRSVIKWARHGSCAYACHSEEACRMAVNGLRGAQCWRRSGFASQFCCGFTSHNKHSSTMPGTSARAARPHVAARLHGRRGDMTSPTGAATGSVRRTACCSAAPTTVTVGVPRVPPLLLPWLRPAPPDAAAHR